MIFALILLAPSFVFADAQQAQRNEVCGRQQSTCIANCKDSQCMTTCYNKYIACRGGNWPSNASLDYLVCCNAYSISIYSLKQAKGM